MDQVKRIVALIDDHPSIVGPEIQTLGIRQAYADTSSVNIDFLMLKFDEIADVAQLLNILRAKRATHVICFRLISLRSLTSNFWEVCRFISDLKVEGIEFASIKEDVRTEAELGLFLRALTEGWEQSRVSYKSENAKVSQIKAKEKGVPLGRPKRRDDSKIIDLRAQGLSIRDIAFKTGVSAAAVQRALKSRNQRDLD